MREETSETAREHWGGGRGRGLFPSDGGLERRGAAAVFMPGINDDCCAGGGKKGGVG